MTENMKYIVEVLTNRADEFFGLSGKTLEDKVRVILEDEFSSVEYQPNGTQNSPDFIVNGDVCIDVKGVRGNSAPVWNSGLPERQTIYVLVSGMGYFIGTGDKLIDDRILVVMDEYVESLQSLQTVINKRLSGSGWSVYGRKMYVESAPHFRGRLSGHFTKW